MIDWLRLRLPRVAAWDLPSDHLLRVSPDGTVVVLAQLGIQVPSFDTSVRVRPLECQIEVSGNPAKWLQGHNLFGPSTVRKTILKFLKSLEEKVGMRLFPLDPLAYCEIHEIHISQLVDMETKNNKHDFLLQLGQLARTRHKRQNVFDGETVYFGRGMKNGSSKLYYWRFYDKEKELLSHKQNRILERWDVGTCVRSELVLKRSALLQLGLNTVRGWTPEKMDSVYMEYLDKIKVAAGNVQDGKLLPPVGLTGQNLSIWYMWAAGNDLRSMWKKTTFYRHRKQLLDVHGLDISCPPYMTSNNVLAFGWQKLLDRNAWMVPGANFRFRRVA